MRTESWSAYHERQITEANTVIERSERVLTQVRLREMGQTALPGFEQVARVIPLHTYEVPQAEEIRDIKEVVKDLTA
jgi:hypothetical protein